MAVDGKGRPTKAQAAQAKLVQDWLAHIRSYEKVYEKWETRADKITKRYRDEDRSDKDGVAKFNILWANIQTLVPATYSRVPQPDVSRRFKDNDPVGRVAGMMLERALEFEVQHYDDYRGTMKACVFDRFLGGRGTAWSRYEPHIRALPGQPKEGEQVTEDVDEPNEELDYECAPVDYVYWKDFGHTLARTWDEVRGVWRKVYMTKKALEERFGDEKAKLIPIDAQPEDYKRDETSGEGENLYRALIYEIWDKETGKAYWLNKSMKEMVDEKEDPLGLEDFFPCPKPLYASLTNDSLVPIPDFSLYQDQARQLDTLADRLDGLIQALQVKGVYDASIPEIARIFTEGLNGSLIPVKNWQAFAEKNGLEGAIDVVDLKNIYEALQACYEAIQACLRIIYDITGLADIIRGQSEASETATAQKIKGQYASLRLNSMKEETALFATHLFQLKAQIMCGKFSPETLVKISGIEQLTDEDKQLVPQALALLLGDRVNNPKAEESPNPLRNFRIEVNADTMVQIDEQAEKESRVEFLTAIGSFMDSATKIVQQSGPSGTALTPMIMSLLKFGVTGFKVGRQVEGIIDATADQLKKLAANPPPTPPDPAVQKAQADAQREEIIAQRKREEEQADLQRTSMEEQAALMREESEKRHKEQMDAQQKGLEHANNAAELEKKDAFERWKVMEDNRTKIRVAEIEAQASVEATEIKAEQAANEELNDDGQAGEAADKKTKKRAKPIDKLAEMHKEQMESHGKMMEMHGKMIEEMHGMAKAQSGPRKSKIIRGPDGRATGVESVN